MVLAEFRGALLLDLVLVGAAAEMRLRHQQHPADQVSGRDARRPRNLPGEEKRRKGKLNYSSTIIFFIVTVGDINSSYCDRNRKEIISSLLSPISLKLTCNGLEP